MHLKTRGSRSLALAAIATACAALTAHFVLAQTAQDEQKTLDASFERDIKPFFAKHCMSCHNSDVGTAGVRVDQLDSTLDDRQVKVWEAIGRRLASATMPPKGLPQPSAAERDGVVAWISHALDVARLRPTPKNGSVRRLTVAQYRNTLRELLQLDDDVAAALPPDAVSKDGFLNNRDSLQLSPLLTEAYFEIAEEALNRAIVDVDRKPVIQDFRVDLGAGVNPAPLPEKLILGAGSQLLDNADVLVTQPVPAKPFDFEPFRMRTKYRFIEGYRGNDTVRGWRDFDSIYHAVFADMRGSRGYPKGRAYSTVPQGLLLRPAIPSDEIFGVDGTYGPKANFKISVRELPTAGQFRVTVTAAKYRDGLLLDSGAKTQPESSNAIVVRGPKTSSAVTVAKAGIYQVDLYQETAPAADDSRLKDGLTGLWPESGPDSPFGKTLSLIDGADGLTVPRKTIPIDDAHHIGEGDFSVAAWIRPAQLKNQGIVSLGNDDRSRGWFLDSSGGRGALRFQTAGTDPEANATVLTPPNTLREGAWQHVAVVVRRGRNETRIYVNGAMVAKSATGSAQYDDENADLRIGRIPGSNVFRGDIADLRLYRRPLEEPELQALLQPGKQLVRTMPQRNNDVILNLGERQFIGALQPAFLVARLDAGPLAITASGPRDLERIVLTPLAEDHELARKFQVFEKRSPRVGVHLGFRRDCGSTFAPVGAPQTVSTGQPAKFIFEGAMRNFPSSETEKDNVNYLAGVREIAVRSEYTDGRDMPRLVIRSVEFEGPFYESWPPASHKNIFVDFDRKSDRPAYARKIIANFATRAYRAPISNSEEATLMSVFQKSLDQGRSFQDSVKDALLVVLTSPQFLFLTEISKTPGPEPLDPYELASKLSYFLWNGPPDRRTLDLAARGTLARQLNAEALRMIADTRFSRFTTEFTSQWLSLDKFHVMEPDRKRYPKLTRDTRAHLEREPIEFVQHLIRNNLPARELIASDFIVANETVADYYDLGDRTESGFQFVPIPHGRKELGGVLTQAAVLGGLSDGRESNPVKRGAWVARKIVAEPPNDPPPNVPPLKEETRNLTLRERLEQHRSAPACMQCHSKIDPWGVALEQFDAGGRLKQGSVDARATLPDNTSVAGIEDLKRHLSEDRIDQVAFSVLKHLETYASGRSLTYNELNSLKRDALKLKPGGYRMRDMMLYVVNSAVFLEK